MSKGKEEATGHTDDDDDEEQIIDDEQTGNEGKLVGRTQISHTRRTRKNDKQIEEDPAGDSENENEDDFEDGGNQ